jgi:hypothetical protein
VCGYSEEKTLHGWHRLEEHAPFATNIQTTVEQALVGNLAPPRNVMSGKRKFTYGGRKSRPKPAESQRFGEKPGERGLRVSSEEFRQALGDRFAVGIRKQDLEQFCAALESIRLLPPSPSMAQMAEQLIAELMAPEVAGVNVIAETRLLVIDRTVDHSGPLPKVTGCDETRVLTILAAYASSQPASLETHIKMLQASGIPIKAKPLTKETVRFELYDEALDVTLGKAN